MYHTNILTVHKFVQLIYKIKTIICEYLNSPESTFYYYAMPPITKPYYICECMHICIHVSMHTYRHLSHKTPSSYQTVFGVSVSTSSGVVRCVLLRECTKLEYTYTLYVCTFAEFFRKTQLLIYLTSIKFK